MWPRDLHDAADLSAAHTPQQHKRPPQVVPEVGDYMAAGTVAPPRVRRGDDGTGCVGFLSSELTLGNVSGTLQQVYQRMIDLLRRGQRCFTSDQWRLKSGYRLYST